MESLIDEINKKRKDIDIIKMNLEKIKRCYIRKLGVKDRMRGI